MKAVVLADGNRVEVAEVPDARIQRSTDALVRMTVAAICMTDVHIKNGHIPGIAPGTVIGHEFVGVVEEVGSAVTSVKPGDRVDSIPAVSCGVCPACRAATPQNCPELSMYGGGEAMAPMGNDGVQAELVRVPLADLALYAIPDNVPDEQGVLIGDMLSTGYHAANEARIQTGDAVVVSGCGPVGLCAILAAWQFGPRQVFAIDMFDNRLAVAEQFGAVPIDLRAGDPVEQVLAATGGRGADAVLEASGSSKAFQSATRMIRRFGTISCVGLFDEPVEFSINQLIYHGVKVVMSLGNLSHVPRLMDLAKYGRVDVSPIATHTFALDEAVAAYDLFENHKDQCLKVLLKP